MKMKKILALSAVAAMATGAMASEADLQKQIDRLKEQLSEVKKQAGGDNLKWDVDFRTSVDMLNYKTVSGAEYKNDALMANRLWLGMGYAPTDNMIFKGQLSFNKAFGANPPANSSTSGMPQRGYGFDTFDWVINENLMDGSVRVREAYWLYKGDHFLGSDVSWTASVGRRPSTNGYLANLREDDKAKSPLGHVINVEFDGASFKFGLDKVTGIDGMYWKLCLGRGLTNANSRFNFANQGLDYAKDTGNLAEDVDMAGFIFVPYDDGQYTVQTTYYRGFNVPGVYASNFIDYSNGADPANSSMPTGEYNFASVGDMDGAAISVMANGVGDGISDFLDDTVLFASLAWSKTLPNDDALPATASSADGETYVDADASYAPGMLGSSDDETGTSVWVGAQFPAMFTEDGRIGIEYNHGSKYWRPFTYAEDTMVGSKLAARGDAYEVYYTQPLMEGFSMQLRGTHIKYDYTGSQGFFAQGGMPMDLSNPAEMAMAAMMGMDPVEEATDVRLYFRYRY